MQDRLNRGLWATVWIGSVLLGVVLCLLYAPLPVDGATGDMTSFTRNGFVTLWLLEVRSGGLQVGDTIILAGGYNLDEWLSGAPRGPEWESGGVVDYEVLRDGTPITLPISLSRVPFAVILGRWWAQVLVSFGLIFIGLFVFLKQSDELPARLMMLFCTMIAVQIWGDAYNFQYALFPHRKLFWFQFLVENGSFILIYASILHFSLVFPKKHHILKRRPRWTLVAVYILPVIVVSLVMAVSTSWTQAMMVGGRVSWMVALTQAILAIIIGIRSYLTASDPVSRAQLRWIVWGAGLVLTIMLPTYIVPMVLIGRSIIPHPLVMLLTALMVVIISVSILRYRLFDIEIVINRTLVYGSLTLLLVGIYILLVRVLTLVTQRIFDSFNESWVVFLSTIIIALAFNPLRLRMQEFIDRTFYREKLNYRQLLPELTARIPSGILTTVLPELMSQELPYMLRISHATLYLLDPYGTKFDPFTNEPWPILPMNHPLVLALKQKCRPIQRRKLGEVKDEQVFQWLEEHQIELALPLLAGDEMVGIYNLGAKLSGSVYNPEEIHLLDQFSSQVALAIKSSRLLQAEQEQRLRAEKLAEQMTALLEETNRRADQLEAVNAIIAVAVAAPEITHLLKGMLDLILDASGGEIGGLLVSGHVYNRGIPEAFLRYCLQISQGMGWVGSSTIVVKDWTNVKEASLAGWAANMMNAGIHSSLIVPVMVGGRHSGVLTLASQSPGEWGPEDVSVIKAVVRQLGSALERLDLLSQTQEQARQVQQILDTVPDGVLLLDESYQIVDANPAAKEYLAYLIPDPPSNQPINVLGGHSMDEFIEYTPEQPWHEVICEGPPRRVFEIAIRSIYEEHPSRGWVVVIRDVSVERENQARTQMQDRLATVGQLAAGIAHDFNNIMAAIQVYVDLFTMDKNISQEGHQRLEIIQNQIFRASGLIRQILDFSRRSVMEETYMDLLPLIKEMEKLLKRLLPENIRVEFQYQPGEYMIKADPTRLQQVFLNLSLNARDAMPSGGVLQFELSHVVFDRGENIPNPEIKPGKWICIVVKDTGIGIPEENLPHVFDPFFTTKKMGQGTGLGLAQVYGIVSGHGGVIDLKSIEGKGTNFTIYLPELTSEAEEPEKSIDIEEISGTGEIILVAEDDPATRDAIRVLLESLNYHVLTASNGEEALQVFQRAIQPIALLVCDMVMPEMDGLPLYQAIKELNGKQLPKVLFVSGYPVDLNELKMDEDDNVDWLQKPFSVQEFAAAVRKALG